MVNHAVAQWEQNIDRKLLLASQNCRIELESPKPTYKDIKLKKYVCNIFLLIHLGEKINK